MQGSFNPEMVPVATHDFFSKWFSNTPMVVDLAYGEQKAINSGSTHPGLFITKLMTATVTAYSWRRHHLI